MIWNFTMTVSHYKATVMPEIISSDNANKLDARRLKKPSRAARHIRIDMTPMVDLGFLLITFFIFTTEISKPAAMNLYIPHDGDRTKMPDSKSMTLLLGANNKVYYYLGTLDRAVREQLVYETSYDELTGIGKIIREKQSALERRSVNKDQLVVLIKPSIDASYKNVIDALDDMLVNGVKRYILCNLEPQEAVSLGQ
jgi:biopolymer transport protein ExbD